MSLWLERCARTHWGIQALPHYNKHIHIQHCFLIIPCSIYDIENIAAVSPADFIGWLAKNARPPAACPLSNSPLIHRFLLPPSKFVGLEVTFPANLWKEKICWCKFHTMYLHVTSSAFSLYLSLFFHFLLCQAPVLSTQGNYHLVTIQLWDYILARFIPSTSNKF